MKYFDINDVNISYSQLAILYSEFIRVVFAVLGLGTTVVVV